MTTLVSLPFTRVLIRAKYLRADADGYIEGFLVAVRVVLNRALEFLVLTAEGAMFDSVPITALSTKECTEKPLKDVETWDALGSRAECVMLDFVRDWGLVCRSGFGRYMFTLHFQPTTEWSMFPDQRKLMHIVELDSGQIAVAVNNEIRWLCEAVIENEMTLRPEANRRFWYSEG